MRRILVGIDGTAESRRAAHLAANMAQAEGKELVLALVLPANQAGAFAEAFAVWRREREQRGRQEMDEVAQREGRTGAPVQTRIIDGDDAAAALAEVASQDELIELVVVGHRTRSALLRALGGSTADRLVQACAKPVLVVH